MNKIKIIEEFAREKNRQALAHEFAHVARVRNWIIKIAKASGYKKIDLAQAAALLHDVGRSVSDDNEHGKIGAGIAKKFLTKNKLFTAAEIDEICFAIAHHNSPKPTKQKLAQILRDADILDLSGAIGMMRAIIHRHKSTDHDPKNIKGKLWNKSNKYLNRLWTDDHDPRETIIDHLNFTISCSELLNTAYAQKIGRSLAKYQKNFIKQFEKEVKQKL